MSLFHAVPLAEVEQGSAEWLAARKQGIGGSDAAAALGMNKWKSPLELWQEKTGQADEFEGNWYTARGNAMEPLIRQHYAERTGREVKIPRYLLQHPVHKFMLASIDGFTDCGRLQEFKTATSDYGWGRAGTDEVPREYLIQCQHNMIVCGLPVADVGVSIAGAEPVYYEIPADRELQEMIINGEAEFWRYVESNTPPAIASIKDALLAYPLAQPITFEANEALADACRDLKAIQGKIRGLYTDADAIKSRVMAEMGTADTLTYRKKVIATWKQSDDGRRFSVK